MSGLRDRTAKDGASPVLQRRGAVRRVPVYSNLSLDLPITSLEIHMVLDALSPEIATLFKEDE